MSGTWWQSTVRQALRVRRRLVPEHLGHGWMPFYGLAYLLFLFLPLVFGFRAGAWRANAGGGVLVATVASVIVFLPLYFQAYRTHGLRQVASTLAIAGLGYALQPANSFSNTYLIYACAFLPAWQAPVWVRLGTMVALLAAYAVELHLLRYPMFILGLTVLIAGSVFFGNHFYYRDRQKQAALRLSHDEVKRLAATAERERIGRDLHDLLGHTLSLVALKSDLAARLLERDPRAAQREIEDVSRVAREALSQVRRAVTGIRAAGIAAQLASSRLLLETDGIAFDYRVDLPPLPDAHETALALALRESVTNVQRHARARRVEVRLWHEAGTVHLGVQDDGRGSDIEPGTGLAGMRERIEAVGGHLSISSRRGQGTRVDVVLPLPAPQPGADAGDRAEATMGHVGRIW